MSDNPLPRARWATTAEACAYLGITRDTLSRWAKRGIVTRYEILPYVIVYDREEFDTIARPKVGRPSISRGGENNVA